MADQCQLFAVITECWEIPMKERRNKPMSRTHRILSMVQAALSYGEG